MRIPWRANVAVTTQSTYRCDVDALIVAIRRAKDEIFAATARYPTTVALHPVDANAIKMSPRYAYPDQPNRWRVLDMRMVEDVGIHLGEARVSFDAPDGDGREGS